VTAQYGVKPKADRDLDPYADYLAAEASLDAALGFLQAAHTLFALLATQPKMGWRSWVKHPGLEALRVFRVTGFEDMLILYQPLSKGVDILRVVHASRNLRALLRREGLVYSVCRGSWNSLDQAGAARARAGPDVTERSGRRTWA
jgi:toxin ParE1/3/4